jgi:hypothetical protein
MNGGIVFRNGGPIGWLGERQERTSLSSCEAEIFVPQAPLSKRSLISEISVEASLIWDFLFLMLPHQRSSTITMTPVSNGLTI